MLEQETNRTGEDERITEQKTDSSNKKCGCTKRLLQIDKEIENIKREIAILKRVLREK